MVLDTNTLVNKMQETQKPAEMNQDASIVTLPFGIIGLPDFTKAEIVYKKEEIPFLHLREMNEDGLEFIVLEPYGFFPNYQVEIGQEDLKALDVQDPSEVHLMNIVTLDPQNTTGTINLIAPLVFNKRTAQGKQVILQNSHLYSATHPLGDNK